MNKVEWLKNAVFYNIYPQSFYDTNGDGIGDLNGITEKLEYVKDMGFDAIWLNPFYESPFKDAGYDITDFYKVAPRYGTNADFERLCEKAHKLGIKVCVDLVAGHTSTECEWFKMSQQHEKNEYTNRYIWTDDWGNTGGGTFIPGFGDRNGCFMKNFFYCQPALNYGFKNIDEPSWQLPMDHPDCRATKQALIDVMEYWLGLGCDGFRVDMAASVVKNDPDGEGVIEFWTEIRNMFDEKYPECVLISEWSHPSIAIKSGFHIDFLIHACFPSYTKLFRAEKGRNVRNNFLGNSFFNQNGQGDIEEFLFDYLREYEATKGMGYISMPTGNHDFPRISYRRTKEDIEVCYAFLFTMPGVPFVYYGDEIGMRYNDTIPSKEGGYNRTGARTPMQWDSSKNLGFSTADSDKLYLPVDSSADAPTVSEQINDENSLLNITKKLIKLRKSQKALSADGDVEFMNRENRGYPLVIKRSLDGEEIIVAINPTDSVKEYTFREDISFDVLMENQKSEYKDKKITLKPLSYSIMKIK